MTRIAIAAVAIVLAALPYAVTGQDKKDRDEVLAAMMKKKLTGAHDVLDGVAMGNFKMVQKGGEDLLKIASSETWQLVRSPHYERHSADFISATENLVKTAKDKNMDGMALAYVEMTLSCVRCHRYVREQRRDAKLDIENPMLFHVAARGRPVNP